MKAFETKKDDLTKLLREIEERAGIPPAASESELAATEAQPSAAEATKAKAREDVKDKEPIDAKHDKEL